MTRPDLWPAPISELAQAHIARDFPNYYGPLESVVTRAFQYIVDPPLGPLLSDWPSVPAEIHNLAGQDAYRADASALATTLRAEARSIAPAKRVRAAALAPAPAPKPAASDQ